MKASKTFSIACDDIENAGTLSVTVKKHLKKLGVDKKVIRRVSIACYEAEINVVIHSNGGSAFVEFDNQDLSITFTDIGPGIEDIELAMQKGYSTASDYARLNGFGAGMGLPNIKYNADKFDLKSSKKGTILKIGFILGEFDALKN